MLKAHDKQIWAAYNHVPGGQIIVTHFERSSRKKRVGDQEIEVTATPMDQLKSYEKSEFVALNLNGSITRNKMLIYTPEHDLSEEPNAADVVIEWAQKQGLKPIKTAEEKMKQDTTPTEQMRRIDVVENKLAAQDEKIDKILAAIQGLGTVNVQVVKVPPTSQETQTVKPQPVAVGSEK